MVILKYPDPRLTAPNARVERFGPEESAKVAEMFQLMMETDGAGLAAPQVGWNVRLFVLPFPAELPGGKTMLLPFTIMNPEIEGDGPREFMPEGCLSFPGIQANVERWKTVRIRAKTPRGRIEGDVTGLVAHAVQHENDHLDGVLFIDRLSAEERARIEPQLEELRAKKA